MGRFATTIPLYEQFRPPYPTEFFRTRFRVSGTIAVESNHRVRVDDLARRILTFSSSSTAVLGDKVEAMLQDVEKRLLPFGNAGMLDEVVVSTAQVAR
jgi:hypothetical protein